METAMRNARIFVNCAIYCLVLTVAAIFTHFNAIHHPTVISDPLTVTPAAPSSVPRATTRGHLQNEQPEIEMRVSDEYTGTAETANQPLRAANEFDKDLLAAMHELMTVPPRPSVRP